MQDLTVIGVEDDSLLAQTNDGSRFRLAIDDSLRARIRQTTPVGDPGARRISPKDVQAHIRSGLTAEQVAHLTGASLDYIERFEGPVLAERQHMVQSALAVPVHTAEDSEPLGDGRTFGSVIDDRLSALGATSIRWASWKEAAGWIVKLSFTAREVEHDARWQFEPRKATLAPLNADATSLSRQGEAPAQLIPRLRAVPAEASTGALRDDTRRFDSGAFAPLITERDHVPAVDPVQPPAAHEPAPASLPRLGERREPTAAPTGRTADLLEALRRRRGERETANYRADEPEPTGLGGGIRLVDIPLDDFVSEPEEPITNARSTQPLPVTHQVSTPPRSQRKSGRAAMPSWDEIVFGARTDDDPA